MQQWRSQKFVLGGAVGQFCLKSLNNIEILYIKGSQGLGGANAPLHPPGYATAMQVPSS